MTLKMIYIGISRNSETNQVETYSAGIEDEIRCVGTRRSTKSSKASARRMLEAQLQYSKELSKIETWKWN